MKPSVGCRPDNGNQRGDLEQALYSNPLVQVDCNVGRFQITTQAMFKPH